MNPKPKMLEVTAITWSDTELKADIKDALEAEGFTFDGEGIKAFLAQELLSEDDEEISAGSELGKLLVEQGVKFLQNNPGALLNAKLRAAGLVSAVMKKFKQ